MAKRFGMCLLVCVSSSIMLAQSKYIQAVDEYLPAPGQFVNMLPEYEEGDDAQKMIGKCTEAIANGNGGLITLGAYGGYVTFHFDHPIINKVGEKDFVVWGNAHSGSSEAGIVMVSVDENGNGKPDDTWYELSGSVDVDSVGKEIYDYQLTYTKQALQNIPWKDNKGNKGTVDRNTFHTQEYFPLWIDASELTFAGTRLPNNAHDTSGNGTYWVSDSFRYGYVDNVPNTDADGNSFNIDWAVDAERNSVKLDHIDFVRVYCALNQKCGWLGETSTEVSGAEDLHPEAVSGINNVTIGATYSKVYSVNGMIQKHLTSGINIIRYSDGTVIKRLKIKD